MGWTQLLDIAHEAAQDRRDREQAPPEACPRCGEPLDAGPDGGLYCPWGDGFEWPRDRAEVC